MSRLQTGALQLVMRDVGLDEVRARSRIAGLSAGRAGRRRRRRDAAARATPTPRCSSARSPTWSRTRSRGRRPTARVRVEACVARAIASTCAWSTAARASRRRDARTCSARSSASATSSNGSGVGLGLAVARGFVEAMGGAHRGRGHARRRRHDGHQPRSAGGAMTRVLVVDDEPQILRALGINLRARGYDVDLAPDGEHALDARRAPPSRRRGARPRAARHRRRRRDPRPARVEHGADRRAVGARRAKPTRSPRSTPAPTTT